MEEGYYWYTNKKRRTDWEICQVKSGYVHFFGQVSQQIGNEYLTEYVAFGKKILF